MQPEHEIIIEMHFYLFKQNQSKKGTEKCQIRSIHAGVIRDYLRFDL